MSRSGQALGFVGGLLVSALGCRPEIPSSEPAPPRTRPRLESTPSPDPTEEERSTRSPAQDEATPTRHVLDAPPWTYALRRPAPLTDQGPPPRLVQLSRKRNEIVDVDAWFTANQLAFPETSPTASSEDGWMPLHVFPQAEATVRTFAGEHHEFRIDVERPRATVQLELRGWREPPEVREADRDVTLLEMPWVTIEGGVMYLSTAHRTYAASSAGRNGYLTALDLETGELLWRSQPLVANANNFVIRQGWIFTGYGFTAEPDFLYVMDALTGEIHDTVPLKSGPEWIVLQGDRLFVRTYDTDYVFAFASTP